VDLSGSWKYVYVSARQMAQKRRVPVCLARSAEGTARTPICYEDCPVSRSSVWGRVDLIAMEVEGGRVFTTIAVR
jgi:hypothetical protein